MIVQRTFLAEVVEEPTPDGLIVAVGDEQPRRKIPRCRSASAPTVSTDSLLCQSLSAHAVQSHAIEHPGRSNAEQDRVTGRDKFNDHNFTPMGNNDTCRVVAPPTFLTFIDSILVCPCGRTECHVDRKTKGMRKPTDIAPLTLAVLDLLSRNSSPPYLSALLAYVARGVDPPSRFWEHGILCEEAFPVALQNAVNRLKHACDYLAVREAECAILRFPYGSKFVGQGKRSLEVVKVLHVKTNYALTYDLLKIIKNAQLTDRDMRDAMSNARKIVLFSFEHTTTAVGYRNSVFAWFSVLLDKAPAATHLHFDSITSSIASLPGKKAEQVVELIFAPLCDPLRSSYPAVELFSRVRLIYPRISDTEINARIEFCASRDGPFGEAGMPHDPDLARLHDTHEHDGHVPPGITAYVIIQKALWVAVCKEKASWTESTGPLATRDTDGYPRRFLSPGCDLNWYDANAVGNSLPLSEAPTVRVFQERKPTSHTRELQGSAKRMIEGSRNSASTLEECSKPSCRVWVGGNSTNGSKKQRPAQWGRRMAKLAALLVTEEEIDEMLVERPGWMFPSNITVPYREERHHVKWSLAFRDAHVAYARPQKELSFDLASPVVVHPLRGTWPGNTHADSEYFGASLSSLVSIRPLLLGEPYLSRRALRNGREHGPIGFKKLGAHIHQRDVLRKAILEPRLDGCMKARGLGMSIGCEKHTPPDWYSAIVAESACNQFHRLAALHDNIVSLLKRRGAPFSKAAVDVLANNALSHANFCKASADVVALHNEAVASCDEAVLNATSRFAKAPKHISVSPIEKRMARIRTVPVVDTVGLSGAFQSHAKGAGRLNCQVASRWHRTENDIVPPASRTDTSNQEKDDEEEQEGEEEAHAIAEVGESISFMKLVWNCILDQLGPENAGFAGPTAVDRGGKRVVHGVFCQTEIELLVKGTSEFTFRWNALYTAEVAMFRIAFHSVAPVETQLDETVKEVLLEAHTLARTIWMKRFSPRQLLIPSDLGQEARKWKATGWTSRTQAKFNRGALVLEVEC